MTRFSPTASPALPRPWGTPRSQKPLYSVKSAYLNLAAASNQNLNPMRFAVRKTETPFSHQLFPSLIPF